MPISVSSVKRTTIKVQKSKKMSSISSESCSFSPASLSLDRRVVDRSIGLMRRSRCGGVWNQRQNLRRWNPWTNEMRNPPPPGRESQPGDNSDAVTMSTVKSAGSVYDLIVSRESEDQARRRQLPLDSASDDFSSGSSSTPVPAKPAGSDSNTNNRNPFSLPDRGNSGLRDVQRHKTEGKQTTIITQFKAAAESNQDGKVDINIIMDSVSNASNALDENSDEDARGSTDNEDSAGGGTTSSDDAAADRSPGASISGSGGGGPADLEDPGEEEGGDAEDSDSTEELPAPGEEKKSGKLDKKKLSMGHLDKEGIVIGCMNVFADVSKKEYIILLTDSVVEAFLIDPGQFRSIARRTGCEIEVTRRILNRRIGGYRWVKYLVVTLRGPNLMAIDQCDRLMVKMFPPYKIRKPYPEAAHVALFVKETLPDNSNLYFNFQRTGPTSARVGDLHLRSAFGKSDSRPLESTPWKQTNPRLMAGVLEPRNLPMAISVEHVYPEWGSEKCSFMDVSCKWEHAGDLALDTEKRDNLERSLRVKQRKLGAEPLFAGAD